MIQNELIFQQGNIYKFPGLGQRGIDLLMSLGIDRADRLTDSLGFMTVYQAFNEFENVRNLTPAEKGLLLNSLNIILTFISRDKSFINNPDGVIEGFVDEKVNAINQLQSNWGVDLGLATILFDARREFVDHIQPNDPYSTSWLCNLDPEEVLARIMKCRPLSVKEAQNDLLRLMAIKENCGIVLLALPTPKSGSVCPGGCR
jgi:hypothetical protein